VRDATSGFRAYRSAALASRIVAGCLSNGYSFQVESTWRTAQAGLRVREVPITFAERRRGRSKMSVGIVAEAMWRVLVWRLASPTGGSDAQQTAGEVVRRREDSAPCS
jgi:dolichol-phosphate mannosyltransferase